jgi:hypothetical protein
MMISRRRMLIAGTALLVAGGARPRFASAAPSPAVAALDKSALIYLTPVVSDGRESACHGEVWFVHHESEVYVVTQANAWRAEAVRKGFTTAKIWIGEFGAWKSANDRYRSAPFLEITGRLEAEASVHKSVLDVFGAKYAAEWGSWGPRFHDGLADGSRVLLRYQVAD